MTALINFIWLLVDIIVVTAIATTILAIAVIILAIIRKQKMDGDGNG